MNSSYNIGVCQGFDLDLNKANIVNFPWLSPTGTIDLNDAEPQCDDAANDDNPVWERPDFGSINAAAAARGRDLVQQWLPGGRFNGNEYVALNPTRDDKRLGSFSININSGAYCDHSSGDGGGDFVALYAFVRGHQHQTDAARALAVELGIDGTSGAFSGPSSGVGGWRPLPTAAAAIAAPTRADRGPDVRLILSKCKPAADTLVEAHLRSRSLSLPSAADIRFADDVADMAERKGYPAMVSVVRYGDGSETGGLHITYLHDDGSKSHKKMLGSVAGGSVRLADMGLDGILGVSEGIESGIAAMMLYPGIPVWASLSTSGMRSFQIPDGCKRLVIFADAGEAGQAAAAELRDTAAAAGVAVAVVTPTGDDDFNRDLMDGHAESKPLVFAGRIRPTPEEFAALLDAARALTPDSPTEHKETVVQRMASFELTAIQRSDVESVLKSRAKLTKAVVRSTVQAIDGEVIAPGTRRLMRNAAVNAMCERYVLVKSTGQAWDREARRFFKLSSVQTHHYADMPTGNDGGPVDPLDYLVKDAESRVLKVDSVTFWPKQPELVMENGAVCLNTYTPPRISPRDGDATAFLQHVDYVLNGDERAIRIMLNWLAHIVQHPDRKIRWMPLIISEEGIGKGLLLKSIAPAIGESNVRTAGDSDLLGDFNGFLIGRSLIVIPEMMLGDRRQVMNKMNTWITDDSIPINQKGVDSFDYPNRFNMLAFSNHEDAALLSATDRRYFVHISTAQPKSDEYYTEYADWLDNGGAEIVAHHLLNRNVTAFNPNGRAPGSVSKDKVIENSRSATDAFLVELFDAGAHPFKDDLFVVNDAIAYLRREHGQSVSTKALITLIGRRGALKLGQRRTAWDERPNMWALRNTERWAAASEDEIKREYYRPGFGAVTSGALADEQ